MYLRRSAPIRHTHLLSLQRVLKRTYMKLSDINKKNKLNKWQNYQKRK